MPRQGGVVKNRYYETTGGARPAASIRAMLVNSYWGEM